MPKTSKTLPEKPGSTSLKMNLRESDVAAEYPVAAQSLSNWRSTGRGPAYIKVSPRLVFYRREDLEKFFDDRKVVPGR